MKLKRITPLIALVIAAILCFTSCSGSNKTTVTELNNGERLDRAILNGTPLPLPNWRDAIDALY